MKKFFLWLIKVLFLSGLAVGATVGTLLFLWITEDVRSVYWILFVISSIAFFAVGHFALTLLFSRLGVVTKEEYAALPTSGKVGLALKLIVPEIIATIGIFVCFI